MNAKRNRGQEYRNIGVTKDLHRRIAHISIDHDISISELTETLMELFLHANATVAPGKPLNYHDLRNKDRGIK